MVITHSDSLSLFGNDDIERSVNLPCRLNNQQIKLFSLLNILIEFTTFTNFDLKKKELHSKRGAHLAPKNVSLAHYI